MITSKNLRLCSLALLLIEVLSVHAQVTNFKMKDYKYRTDGMKAIGVLLNANSSASAFGSSYLNMSFNPSSVYTRQYSKENRQLILWNWSNMSLSHSNAAENSGFIRANSRLEWTRRNYQGMRYIQYGSGSAIDVYRGKQTIGTTVSQTASTGYNLTLNPNAGAGQGRLEFVSNAQMALFILEDLKEAGKIKNPVPEEVADKFTDLITQLYNTRIFDFRKRRNYEVAKIDSFLRQNKIITATDVETYNIIADNWNYAIQPAALESTYFTSGTLQVQNPNMVSDRINQFGIFNQLSRYNGTRKSVLLSLPTNWNNGNQFTGDGMTPVLVLDSLTKSRTASLYGANATVQWEQHAAINLHRQRIISAWIQGGALNNTITTKFNTNQPDSSDSRKTTNFSIGARYDYGYFPNSRTVVNLFNTAGFTYSTINRNNQGSTNLTLITLSSYLSGSYFLTFRSRISGHAGIDITPKGAAAGKLNFSFGIRYLNYLF